MSGTGHWPSTLGEAIDRQHDPDCGITFVSDGKAEHVPHYVQRDRALGAGGALRALGLRAGDRILVAIPDNATFASVFLGCIAAGAIPAAVAPPRGPAEAAAAVDRICRMTRQLDAGWIVLGKELEALEFFLQEREPAVRVVRADALLQDSVSVPGFDEAREGDACYVQFTSGTTGDPKPVLVRHGNLAANARAILRDGMAIDGRADVVVSWVPLFHDMGLVGFLLGPMFVPVPSVIVSPDAFVRRPRLWLETLNQYGGTVTFGPPFAYLLALRDLRPTELDGLDLSSLRIAGCGADPISCDALRQFAQVLSPAGLRRSALMPAYGLAESTLAVAFASTGAEPRSIRADREALARGRVADASTGEGVEFASCGKPFPDHEIRIACSDCGAPAAERRLGEIQLRGPSMTTEYYGEPATTADAFDEAGWFSTGDLGFQADGELYVCGRACDSVRLGRRRFLAHDLEAAVQSVADVRLGGCLVFSDALREGDSALFVAVETSGARAAPGLRADVAIVLERLIGVTPERVWVLARRALPRSSSGKLRRVVAKAALKSGAIDEVGGGAEAAGAETPARAAGGVDA